MRIIHVHKYFHSRDGASRYEQGLMRLQEEAGHAVAPFAMHEERNEPTPWSEYFVSNFDTRHVSFGLGAFSQAARAFWNVEAKKKFGAMLDVFHPDVVHAHNIYTQLSPSVLAAVKERGIPVVMTVHDYALVSANYALWNKDHNMDLKHLGIWSTAKTKYIKGSFLATLMLEGILKAHHALNMYDGAISHYITYSTFVRDILVHAGFTSEKISVLHSFAEPLMSDCEPSPLTRGSRRGSIQSPFILFAGRLETYKGVRVLLESLKHLPKDVRVMIAGVGPDEEKLRAMVAHDPRVTFLGFVPGDKLSRLMGEATAVVVPSIWYEPYGLVALEAMCQGTPIIVAKSGGLPEIVGESEAGIIVPPGDSKALARAIHRIIENKDLAGRMGKAAFDRAKEIGNPQEHLAKIMEIYSKCG
ncbi:MAG: glycosyltransferase [Patescibacteria group bacterium]|jgi:glycosyltransferase involved in cell wall biosynthesis